MHDIYLPQEAIKPPTTMPDKTVESSFFAAEDGKYEVDATGMYRRTMNEDDDGQTSSVLGYPCFSSENLWSRRTKVYRLPPQHAEVTVTTAYWTINKRLKFVVETMANGSRTYFRGDYAVDDPHLADVLRPYVESPTK
jgi:hypothetical protein